MTDRKSFCPILNPCEAEPSTKAPGGRRGPVPLHLWVRSGRVRVRGGHGPKRGRAWRWRQSAAARRALKENSRPTGVRSGTGARGEHCTDVAPGQRAPARTEGERPRRPPAMRRSGTGGQRSTAGEWAAPAAAPRPGRAGLGRALTCHGLSPPGAVEPARRDLVVGHGGAQAAPGGREGDREGARGAGRPRGAQRPLARGASIHTRLRLGRRRTQSAGSRFRFRGFGTRGGARPGRGQRKPGLLSLGTGVVTNCYRLLLFVQGSSTKLVKGLEHKFCKASEGAKGV